MKNIHLYGELRNIVGMPTLQLAGDDIRVLMSGVNARVGGNRVKQYLINNQFQVKYNDDVVDQDQVLGGSLEGVTDIHLYPVIEGAGSRGAQIVLGAALIVAGVFTGGASWAYAAQVGSALITTGTGLVLSGVFAQRPSSNMRERPDERSSFIFNGAVNSVQEGTAIPLVYGRHRVGSIVVSASLDVSEVAVPTVPYGSNPAPPGVDPNGPGFFITP